MISKTQRKYIFDELFSRFREELSHIHVYLATGSRVIIRFAGIYEEFCFHDGQVYRLPSNANPDQQDADVLFALAKDINSAVRAGYAKPSEVAVTDEERTLFDRGEIPTTKPLRKKRSKVAPVRKSNNTQKRTSGALRKARSTLLYQLYKNKIEHNNFAIQKSTTEAIDIRSEGSVHHLEFSHGVATHKRGDQWVSREMFVFLCCFAKDVMAAVLEGYKSTNPTKERITSTSTQMELPLWQQSS